MFADDCLLYREIRDEYDTRILQADFDSLQRWEQDWSMAFNPSKCEAITFTKKTKPMKGEYKPHSQVLTTVPSAKYPGVHLNNKLSWNNHVDITTKKASQTVNFVRRNFLTCPSHIREQCYKTLVRPQLEYASTVWDNSVKRHGATENAGVEIAGVDRTGGKCRSGKSRSR